jgi:hypothetical protein
MSEYTFTQKFAEVQSEITAPKKKNSGVPYASRSAEQILESAKPSLLKHGLICTIDSTVLEVAGRLFIESVAYVTDGTTTVTGKAQAELMSPTLNSRGVPTNNESQLSGASGSYADKYALQKLFAIGNGDDADDAKYQPTETYQAKTYNSDKLVSEKQVKLINFKLDELKKSSITAFDAYKEWYKTNCGNKKVEALTMSEAKLAIDQTVRSTY